MQADAATHVDIIYYCLHKRLLHQTFTIPPTHLIYMLALGQKCFLNFGWTSHKDLLLGGSAKNASPSSDNNSE